MPEVVSVIALLARTLAEVDAEKKLSGAEKIGFVYKAFVEQAFEKMPAAQRLVQCRSA